MPSSHDSAPHERRTLEQIIARKQGILSPSDTAATAGDTMRALHTDSLPVSEGRRLVGMVNDPNPDRRAAGFGHDPNSVRVGESMDRNAVYCFEDQSPDEALKIMAEAGLQRLPVVDRAMRILGSVSREDLHDGAPPA